MVLAGTSEGRETAALLLKAGWQVLASVTTRQGEELLRRQGIENIVQGELGGEGLIRHIIEKRVRFLVDATHPFASMISIQAMEAAASQHIPYLRLERAGAVLPPDPLVSTIDGLEELEAIIEPGMKVFSTLGGKSLPDLVPLTRRKGAQLTVRVLPGVQVLQHCSSLGLAAGQIVAMQGPFSRELNRALFREYQANLILTKESGPVGGVEAKIQAALDLQVPVVVWKRPPMSYPLLFHSSLEIVQYLAGWGKESQESEKAEEMRSGMASRPE